MFTRVNANNCSLQGGWSSLMWASYKGHEEIVVILLENGADVHAHGNYNIKYVATYYLKIILTSMHSAIKSKRFWSVAPFFACLILT